MRKRYLFRIMAVISLICSQPALAWKETGHQEVVAYAWSMLDEPTRGKITSLLAEQHIVAKTQGLSGEAAWIAAATWPDELRQGKGMVNLPPPISQRQWLERARSGEGTPVWHFTNRNIAKPFAGQKSTGLLDQALPVQIQILGDKTLSSEDRAMALVWVSHLVGDAHQPMHCATREVAGEPGRLDGGGNLVTVIDPQRNPPEPVSMHRWWDELPGRAQPGSPEFAGDLLRLAEQGQSLPYGMLQKPPIEWMNESFDIARDYAYPGLLPDKPGTYLIDVNYRETSLGIAEMRVTLAGQRLAAIVKNALKE